MAIGAFLEPLIVVILLFGGAWLNRNKSYNFRNNSSGWAGDLHRKRSDDTHLLRTKPRASAESWSSSSSPVLTPHELAPRRRRRKLQAFGYRSYVSTPNTSVFKDRFLSRVLRKFPFLTEAWYWALIYWVYQLGRAVTALTVVKGTVHVARKHALQVIRWEKSLRIFWELPFQKWFLARPALLHWVNRVYSFIHIPGTIGFLVVLFYLTTTRQRCVANGRLRVDNAVAGPALYEARRRTMAMCNLIAFIVFTLWPCMPPRLLSDPDYMGGDAEEAKSFGFADTVHSKAGESSVWTTNKFCNQYGKFSIDTLGNPRLPNRSVRVTNTLRLLQRRCHLSISGTPCLLASPFLLCPSTVRKPSSGNA